MPLLKKGVPLPVKGTDYSAPSKFLDDRNGFAVNMRYDKALLRKRPGKTQIGAQTPDSDQIMGYGVLQTSDGSKYLLRASKRKIQALSGSNTWGTISIISFTGGDDDFFDFANVPESDLIISTNYLDAMYKWDGSGNQTVLGGTPPKAKYITYLSPYVLAAYTDDGVSVEPWRVAWSDTGNPENWTTGNSGEAVLGDEPSVIQNIKKLNEYVAVYKKESLWLGRKVDTSDIFLFDNIMTGIGLASPRCIADAEGRHYFMSANDFHSWNGFTVLSIGSPVREYIFGRINRSKMNRCFAMHIQTLYEIWFFIVISGNDWPTEVWKYNYKLDRWDQDTCDSITAATRWESTHILTWDEAVGTWDSQQISWDEASQSQNAEQTVFGDSVGLSSYLDYTTVDDLGVAVSAYFESKDYVADKLEISKRWLELHVWAKGPGKLYVDYSTDFGENWTNIPYQESQVYIDLNSIITKYELYFDVWAEKVRFRFRNAESGETFYLESFYPMYLEREEIRTYRSS